MRHRELRRYFLMLAAAAAPLPIGACGGSVSTGDGNDRLNGGETGGTGGTGGYPFAPGFEVGGGGYPFVSGTGGAPPYYGGTGGTGGYPFATGTGGCSGTCPPYYPPADAAAPIDANTDAPVIIVDAGPSIDGAIPDDAEVCTTDGGDAGPIQCSFRKPPGLESPKTVIDGDVRGYFAEMARLEAASVTAFRVLAWELALHDAPKSLRRFTRLAAREEIRHTRMGRALAQRFGAPSLKPNVWPLAPRTIEAIATDNASEGCVRETFGAVIATWQAKAAGDEVVRDVMRQIAIDETRHAMLALHVAAWANQRLDKAARARVLETRRRTGEQVVREAEYQPSPALVAVAGVPRRDDARRLSRAMNERLWA